MQRPFWKLETWKLWAAAALSAVLLELPFPLPVPCPMARHLRVGWPGPADLGRPLTACLAARRPMRRAFLLAYLCGFLWYMGNCYWFAIPCRATATCRRWRPRCC